MGITRLDRAQAATYTWDGGSNGRWNVAANWNPDGAPASADTTDLLFTGATQQATTLEQIWIVHTITYAQAGFSIVNQGGKTLTLSGSGAGIASTGNTGLDPDAITLEAATTFTSNAGTLAFASHADITNGGFVLTVGGAGDTSMAAVISGAGGLSKQDSGTLTLTADNSYTGITTIRRGHVQR